MSQQQSNSAWMDDSTPLLKQYWELKAQAGDALLLFRMGDFYELFGEDAIEAARILEITLTTRDKNKPNPMPMAGVPHHSAQGYIQRLLKAGKKVAIGEQLEDPTKLAGKAIVKRGIVRTFTPGVQFDVEGAEACYIAAVTGAGGSAATGSEGSWYLACLDASTGEALVSEKLSSAALATELGSLPIRHLLRLAAPGGSRAAGGGACEDALDAAISAAGLGAVLVEQLPPNYLAAPQAEEVLKRHYEVAGLDAFIPDAAAAHPLGIVVTYAIRSQQQERLAHLRLPAPLRRPRALALGPRAAQHLDLVPAAEGAPSLFQLVNRARSALGARQLRRWLLAPLKSAAEIAARQQAVRELAGSTALCDKLSAELAQVYDLERISGRINAKLANPRDTLALGKSLSTLPAMAALVAKAQPSSLRALGEQLARAASQVEALGREITSHQREDAPLTAREGGIFNLGTTPDLDRLISLTEDGQKWLIELEAREREATGIPSLKVRYNKVFGYYIEITQAHLKNAPAHYQRKQTTVGAERFFTEELKKFEEEILTASIRQKALEQELFELQLESCRQLTGAIMEAARCLGELDALTSLARLAQDGSWCFPEIDESMDLEIEAGRHPLVDAATRGAFVPNSLELSPESRLTLVITGPNMGGKSTVMRQTALIVILGQMGAPVPAARARWGAVSSLHTRIGAHDAIARGQSTFMVEMSELAHILHHADERSLIVLDEIGRGTSTYDGISVAWATLEWIATQIRCRTLFATHYHELTRLTGTLPGLANAHMAVESAARGLKGDSHSPSGPQALRFLYELREGPANESFGVHVARIAGLPKPVVERAWQVLDDLEQQARRAHGAGGDAASAGQLSLFEAASRARASEAAAASGSGAAPAGREREPGPPACEPHPVVHELESADVNDMTPVQALNFVVRLQELTRDGAPGARS